LASPVDHLEGAPMQKVLLCTVTASILAGCAAPASAPISTTAAAPVSAAALPAPCTFIRVEQRGLSISPVDGIVMLGRAPFTIAYVGPGTSPGLNVSTNDQLATMLTGTHRPEVWTSFGEAMAGEPGLIIVNDRMQVWHDTDTKKAASHLVLERYWPMVQQKVEAAHDVDHAIRAPLNTWWEPARGTAPRVYPVETINGTRVDHTKFARLHIVAIGEMESLSVPRTNMPLLARSRWNACTLKFR
jgi:hypothetical protein